MMIDRLADTERETAFLEGAHQKGRNPHHYKERYYRMFNPTDIQPCKDAPVILDDRSPEDKANTYAFVIATDRFMSYWTTLDREKYIRHRSIVARPVRTQTELETLTKRFHERKDFQRVRHIYGNTYKPRLHKGDHCHIYGFNSFNRKQG